MPTYVYKCQACENKIEIIHSMAECDNPSEELLEQITCPFDRDCQANWQNHLGMEIPRDHELILQRVPHAPQVMGMYCGSSLSGKEKTTTIQKERKIRSHNHFKKEIFPTIPKAEKKFFKEKWKKEGKE